jgi:hypothetical protein
VLKTLIILVAAVAATAALAGPAANGATSACREGTTTVGGGAARVFCGGATAVARIGGKKLSFRNGRCETTSDYLTVNLGTIVLGSSSKAKPEYFGLTVGRLPVGGGTPAAKDGTFHNGIVALVHAGKSYLLRGNATVVLKNGRTRGTFKTTLLEGGTVTGSFAC